MPTNSERIQTINQLASETGKPRAALLETLAKTWELSDADKGAIKLELLTTPEPPTPAQARAAAVASQSKALEAKAAEQQLEADANALTLARRHAELKKSNPIAASALFNAHGDEIVRGRNLGQPDPGPQAA